VRRPTGPSSDEAARDEQAGGQIDLYSLGPLPPTICRKSFPHPTSIMTGIAVASIRSADSSPA